MTISMHKASIPVLTHTLSSLSAVLDKAEAHCTLKKIAPETMLGARLIADMLPLSRQVQIACDFAKGAAARLAGVDVPSWPDDEKTFADLKARITKTRDYVSSFSVAQIDGSEARAMQNLKVGGNPIKVDGQPYLLHFVLPNFFFHTTTAYAILRANGVEIGKGDFLGAVPGVTRNA